MAGRRPDRSAARRSFRDAAADAGQQSAELPAGDELTEGWLTQFGTDHFRECPRFEMEFDVSVLKGKLSLSQTVYALFGRAPNDGHNHRHFDIVKLARERYRCLHTPSRRKPTHASILASCPEEDIEAHKSWWADRRRVSLHLIAESGV